MPTRQFTDRAFNGVALMHLQLKGLGALFDPASLQKLMVLADNQRAIRLVGWNAMISQRAALAVALAPLEAVGDLGFAVLANAAATPAFVARRAISALMRNIHRELFDRQAIHPWSAGARLRRPHQRPAFLGSAMQPRAGDVPAVGIEFRGPFQAALGLRLQGLIQARLIALGGFLK
jgi:hypothetical protein